MVDELGQAFEGTGQDLSTILDTSSEFIKAADENIDVTRSLINDSSSVLQTQIDKQGELGTFSKNLALLSDSLVDADPDLRRLFDKGSESAATLNAVVNENSADLGNAIRDLVTANKPLSENVLGLQAIFILYPYLVEGSFSVLDKVPGTSDYNATFGLVMSGGMPPPPTCTYAQNGEASGYTKRRAEQVISDKEFLTNLDCNVPDNKIARQPCKTEVNGKRPVACPFKLDRAAAASETSAPNGKDSWKWLLLGPAQQ